MSTFAELSPAGMYEIGADLRSLGRKMALGWIDLAAQLRRFGSIPADERAVASILGVSVRYLRERAWPLLEDRLTLSEDGRRYTCPEIVPWNGRARSIARTPAPTPIVKKVQQQNAAFSRWGQGNKARASASETHAPTHADACGPHAETHGISMPDASKTHAFSHPVDASDASGGASGRIAGAHALSLSTDDSLSTDSIAPIAKKPSVERESAPASDAPAHAPTDAPTHAPTDAPAYASKRAKRMRQRPVEVPMTADWQPSAESLAEARKRGIDPAALTIKFRDHYISKGEMRAEWDGQYRNWCRTEDVHRQGNMTMAMAGGKAEATPAAPVATPQDAALQAAALGTGLEAQWARVNLAIKGLVGASAWTNWLAKARLGEASGDEITITLSNRYLRDHVRAQYGGHLLRAWQIESPHIRRVNIEVSADQRTASA